MKINLLKERLELNEQQEAQIIAKFEKLTHFADRLGDESSEMKINLAHEPTKKPADAFNCFVTIFAPRDTLRAHSHKDTLENAIDDVLDKLKGQIEHYKSKLHHLEDRK